MKTSVTFPSAGLKLAGHLYMPDDGAVGPRPAIVVSHPGSGVKEQAAGLYARRLAEQGFVTLAFDAAHQGESEGEPRGLEDPAHRVEDIKAAVSYVTVRADVDAEQIGVLGICASGGYAITAAASDHRIKAVGTVSAVDIARQFRDGADGTQDPAVFQGMLDAAAAARTAEARGEGVQTFPLFPDTAEQARALGGQHAVEGCEYYCSDRAQHPRSAKFFTWSSIDRMACFDAFSFAPLIAPRPAAHGRRTRGRDLLDERRSLPERVGPKELHWIDGASHVDLYDKERYVGPAVEKLTDFFRAELGDAEQGPARNGNKKPVFLREVLTRAPCQPSHVSQETDLEDDAAPAGAGFHRALRRPSRRTPRVSPFRQAVPRPPPGGAPRRSGRSARSCASRRSVVPRVTGDGVPDGSGHGALALGVGVHGGRGRLRRERLDPPFAERPAEVVPDGRGVGVHLLGPAVTCLPGQHRIEFLLRAGDRRSLPRSVGLAWPAPTPGRGRGIGHHDAGVRRAVVNTAEHLRDLRWFPPGGATVSVPGGPERQRTAGHSRAVEGFHLSHVAGRR